MLATEKVGLQPLTPASASVTPVNNPALMPATAMLAWALKPVLFCATGGSFTGFTVIVKLCGADVSTPPLAVPPLSESVTEIAALPLALAAGV